MKRPLQKIDWTIDDKMSYRTGKNFINTLGMAGMAALLFGFQEIDKAGVALDHLASG